MRVLSTLGHGLLMTVDTLMNLSLCSIRGAQEIPR